MKAQVMAEAAVEALQRPIDLEATIVAWANRLGVTFLRFSIGIVFFWFGALKLMDASPAADLASRTIYWLPSSFFVPFLGTWEVTIGVCMMCKRYHRLALLLLLLHMPGTFLPFFVLTNQCFTHFPIALTMEGQYIIKNLVLISAGIVIAGKSYRE